MAAPFLPTALSGLLSILGLAPAPAAPQVAAPIVASAAANVRGTMVMIHGGAWKGPDANAQQVLMDQPGDLLVKRGWRVVSVDYHAGANGMRDVMGVVAAQPAGQPLCLYGESAGAQLALMTAAQVQDVDCVIAAGAPIDFESYLAQINDGDPLHKRASDAVTSTFGDTPAERAPWEPLNAAADIRADVLLLHQDDDRLVPAAQNAAFHRARPASQNVELSSGDASNPADWWLHGTLDAAGRARYLDAIGSFADRALASYRATQRALRTGCDGVADRYVPGGGAALRSALRCLARRDDSVADAKPASSAVIRARLRGEITAARVWSALRATTSGLRALAAVAANRAGVAIRAASKSVVAVRPHRR